MKIKMRDGEIWYGGSVAEAMKNPFDKNSKFDYDISFGGNG